LTDVSDELQIIRNKVSEQDYVAALSWGVEKSNGKIKKKGNSKLRNILSLGVHVSDFIE
jgi:hypothetical protein